MAWVVRLVKRPPLVKFIAVLRTSWLCPNVVKQLIDDTVTYLWITPFFPITENNTTAVRKNEPLFSGFVKRHRFHQSIADVASEIVLPVFESKGVKKIVDMFSNVGDFWFPIAARFMEHHMEVVLTDPSPQTTVWKRKKNRSNSLNVNYIEHPVTAKDPEIDCDVRTYIGAFHQLSPRQARESLAEAIHRSQGIAIFELGERSWWFLMLLVCLYWTIPYFSLLRGIRWSASRIFFTFAFPVLPFIMLIDGIISVLRMRTDVEILEEIETIPGHQNYSWKFGCSRSHLVPIWYCVGFPVSKKNSIDTSTRSK